MQNISFGRARSVPGRPFAADAQTLRRASLLIGTSFLLHAAPALAANECGPAPPGGGTVTCPAGTYPTGIDYVASDDLEILLAPGVVTSGTSSIAVAGDFRLIGPTGTSLNVTPSDPTGSRALFVDAQGSALIQLDQVSDSVGGDVTGGGAEILGTIFVDFSANSVTTIGNNSDAINIFQFSGLPAPPMPVGILVQVNSVATTGNNSSGIDLFAADGSARTVVGTVTTQGSDSPGVFSIGAAGQANDIESAAIATNGSNSTGIEAIEGIIGIDSGSVTTAGPDTNGIEARSTENVSIVSGSVQVTGFGSKGIEALSLNGGIRITSEQVATRNGTAIEAVTNTGDIFVDSGTVATAGFAGVISLTSTSGDIEVESGTVISSAPGFAQGISVLNTDGDIRVLSGAITILGQDSSGILARALGAGNILVDSDRIDATGLRGIGIQAIANSGTVEVVSRGDLTTSGDSSPALLAQSNSGRVEVTSSSITTLGNQSAGISARSAGGVAVDSGSVATGGDQSVGIVATGDNSDVTVISDQVTTAGDESPGIQASATGSGDVTVTSGDVSTAGSSSPGILADAEAGDLAVTSSGTVATTGRSVGINVRTTAGDISIASFTVVTAGGGAGAIEGAGILADSATGAITIVSGSVTTDGTQAFGIRARSGSLADGGDVNVASGTIATAGDLANGIFAVSRGGGVTVTTGPISTLGDSASGVVTFVSGPGATSVRAGSIATQGFDSYGVIATSTGTGAVDVASDGTIVTTGASSPGISAESAGPVSVSANNVSAGGADSDAIAVKGSTSLVTIRGTVQSTQGFAVRGEGGLRQRPEPGGPVTVNILAGAALGGRVSLTSGGDLVANSGTFNAVGTSLFGAGADQFNNLAGGSVRSLNGAAAFAGLESFANQSLIEMRDGATNDSLTLPGAYSGAGGARLGLDVNLSLGTADRLVTGAATGSTLIDVATTGQAKDFNSSILLVDAGAGTVATAFALGAGGTDTPYLETSLRFDPAGNDFFLVQAPGTAVFETARLAGLATTLWYESADAVAAQLDSARDAGGGRGLSLWLQGWTGEQESRGTQSFAGEAFDVSWHQDYQGLQGGIDYRTGPVAIGLTAGVGRSDALFGATGDPVDIEARNVGLYLQGQSRLVFFNALAKFDEAELDIAPGPGLGATFDSDQFGIQANAGLRFAFGQAFAEPSVGLSWVRTEVDSFASGAATVGPASGESLRARAGLRAGARFPFGGGAFIPFVVGNVYEELDGRYENDFTLGQTLRLVDDRPGTQLQAAAGASFVAGGFEAFARAEADFSGGADSKAIRAGVRLRF